MKSSPRASMRSPACPSPAMHHLHFRVVDNAIEAPADQYSGDMWGLYMAVEDPDGSFLDERGLPDGNVYHIAGNGGDKTHQGLTHPDRHQRLGYVPQPFAKHDDEQPRERNMVAREPRRGGLLELSRGEPHHWQRRSPRGLESLLLSSRHRQPLAADPVGHRHDVFPRDALERNGRPKELAC